MESEGWRGALSRRPDIRAALGRAASFSGWTFDGEDAPIANGELPWDYQARARVLAATAARTIDLGTGGGEIFARIVEGLSGHFFASEEWDVNAAVARRRLGAAGVPVVRGSSERPPFRDGAFDLVLSRHEAIDPPEIDRVLAPGGTFLTQQVCPEHWPEIKRYIPRATTFPDHWTSYRGWFEAHGYAVHAQRHDYRAAYRSLATVVYLLSVMPWEVPGFDIDRDAEGLLALEREMSGPDGIILSEGRYIIEARKPG